MNANTAGTKVQFAALNIRTDAGNQGNELERELLNWASSLNKLEMVSYV